MICCTVVIELVVVLASAGPLQEDVHITTWRVLCVWSCFGQLSSLASRGRGVCNICLEVEKKALGVEEKVKNGS